MSLCCPGRLLGRVRFHSFLERAHPQYFWGAILWLPVFSFGFILFYVCDFSSWILVHLTTAVSTVLSLSAILPFLFGYLWPLDFTTPSHNLAFPQVVEPKLPNDPISNPKFSSNAVEPLEGVKSLFPEESVNQQSHSYFPRKEKCRFRCVNIF